MSLSPGQQVRVIADPSQVGTMTDQFSGPANRQRVVVNFPGGMRPILLASLEAVPTQIETSYDLILNGRFGHAKDLRGAITNYRLNGKLANLIYSLNTTNTQFLSYQFKPVLQFLDSPSNSILIADEVGLGKTIEAGLIWTELKARQDAKRLLVLCPAMLRHKWKQELKNRFGVNAEIQDAKELLETLKNDSQNQREGFAIICSMQGLRPSKNWDDDEAPSKSNSAQLARFLNEAQDNLFDLVIIDEAHYLRNKKTQTYIGGKLLRQWTQNLVMLSATPIQTKSTDLFNLLQLLDESAYPYEFSFDEAVKANAPLVQLRSEVLGGTATPETFQEKIKLASYYPLFEGNKQLAFFKENPPSSEDLKLTKQRSKIANQLDKINFLSKTITRTLKRDVHTNHVERQANIILVELKEQEKEFYDEVTNTVIQYCQGLDVSQGFLLTSPQRQMASCIPATHAAWLKRGKHIAKEELAELEATSAESFGYDNESEDYDDDAEEIPNKNNTSKRADPSGILATLSNVTRKVGDTKSLMLCDSKFETLLNLIKTYWIEKPNKKIVLFSFYKNTLHYLNDRLQQQNVNSVVLHGGMDKQPILDAFKEPDGPKILLSSEVASEGVDLQFCSVLINYDLPWNPAKLEQRIGRIDRIGQEEPSILIFNLVYKNTVDERIYTRLIQHIKQSSRILGSMEKILGEQIKKLSYELLTHKLTPEQQINRIEQTSLALANLEQQEETLELAATHLMAHGDFTQNKVKAAKEQGRYIKGSDLYDYVNDFFGANYAGTYFKKVANTEADELLFELNLSIAAKQAFTDFVNLKNLQGKTALLRQATPKILFENIVGNSLPNIERITQEHPLIQFISERLKSNKEKQLYYPVTAITVASPNTRIKTGVYVYYVVRWSFKGSKLVEQLEYLLINIDDKTIIEGDDAEFIVNTASSNGKDWLAAKNEVNCDVAAEIQEECFEILDKQFLEAKNDFAREDSDRAQMQIQQLKFYYNLKLTQEEEIIRRISESNNERAQQILRARKGQKKLENLKASVEQKIQLIEFNSTMNCSSEDVSTGLIKII